MNSKAYFIIMVLFIALFIMLWLHFNPKSTVTSTFDDKPYLDSIASLKAENTKLDSANKALNYAYQLLELQKEETKIIYAKKLKFVYTASPFQLDSIIALSVR